MREIKENIDIKIKSATKLLQNSKYTVVFTGAGMSVESGISPYRGKGGLWNTIDPKKSSYSYFLGHPASTWDLWKDIMYGPEMTNAKPNKGHDILAKWENKEIIKSVITQNIDNLHKEA